MGDQKRRGTFEFIVGRRDGEESWEGMADGTDQTFVVSFIKEVQA
jgi:hypothetical protein